MQLVLVRHAIAVDTVEGLPDAARPLTRRGRQRMAEVVRGLRRLGLELDELRHSPWTRAVETADLLAPLCRGQTVVEPLLARAPGDELLDALAADAGGNGAGGSRRCVALVGHQPWMGELAGWLVWGRKVRGGGLEWKKAGIALLEGEPRPGGMVLQAFLPPRMTRRLGRE